MLEVHKCILTHPNYLFPVGITHVVIIHLCTVSLTHGPSTGRNLVELSPQGLQNFSILLSSPINKVQTVSGKAAWCVSTEVKLPNSRNKFVPFSQLQVRTSLNTLQEMATPLAGNVIDDESSWQAIWIIWECVTNWVVHVHLSLNNETPDNLYLICWYLSPFWKSTTECGTKQPCLEQAHAPIPVDSRFFRLANVLLLAR